MADNPGPANYKENDKEPRANGWLPPKASAIEMAEVSNEGRYTTPAKPYNRSAVLTSDHPRLHGGKE